MYFPVWDNAIIPYMGEVFQCKDIASRGSHYRERFPVMRMVITAATMSTAGNIAAKGSPCFSPPPMAPVIIPTRVGPPEQPASPASASNANIAVPPRLRRYKYQAT